MNIHLKVLIVFIIGLNGLIMCRGWISVFSQNLPFVNALMALFQQNRNMVILFVLILSFLFTIIALVSFSWATKKVGK